MTRRSGLKRFRKYTPLYLLMLPGIAYLIINNYAPMFGMFIAFKNINFSAGIFESDWIGFKNFEYLFKTTDAFIITRNTILYNAAFIVIGTVLSIAVAILLNEIRVKVLSRFYQSVIVLPHLISFVVVGYLVYAALSLETGFMNKTILPLFGIESISWYTEPKYWPVILTVVQLWKSVGFSCIIFLASIISIDPEYYEAARLDGASKWRQIQSITIPLITPVIVMLTLLSIGRMFYSDFGLFYQVPMNSGMLNDTTNVIDTYVYRSLMIMGDIGMASAAGVYQSIVGFVLVLSANYIVRKFNRENALF
ncbi:ABC transporter permease subunit [Virgibacillus sp. LDC1]|uniref:ABC transporter permease n=1 Tax=Bacillales TaxID=1385 RepID=UPI00020724B4|nr:MULTISPECIES: ABC transporter permease subunit [Paenibacillus]EGG34938.1 ABC transporter, permease protein [Paenibacillus sp. HGF5]MCV4232894.1 ABC transporter permease subunit [Virgibacillus sp. LDC1]MEC0308906.1 ABC transporter permease subunit [Paenibacillus lautus]PJN56890.1 putative multiple-sugar transport system permease YteP [Paenibacillus sp. GM2FR]